MFVSNKKEKAMPEISVRGLEMPESPIRKLAPLAADAKKRGIKVYHLNIGQPDLPTPQVGLDAMKHIDRDVLEYSPSQGYLSYREKLTDYYKRFRINVNADDIIITADCSEAVLFAFLSCLNPGDEIINALSLTTGWRLLESNVRANRIQQKIALGKNLPTVAVGAGCMYDNLMDKSHPFAIGFISLSVPVSSWRGGSHAVKRQNLQVKNAENMLADNSELLVIAMKRLGPTCRMPTSRYL